MRGIHRGSVDTPHTHKGPVMQKAFPCHDVIMLLPTNGRRPSYNTPRAGDNKSFGTRPDNGFPFPYHFPMGLALRHPQQAVKYHLILEIKSDHCRITHSVRGQQCSLKNHNCLVTHTTSNQNVYFTQGTWQIHSTTYITWHNMCPEMRKPEKLGLSCWFPKT